MVSAILGLSIGKHGTVLLAHVWNEPTVDSLRLSQHPCINHSVAVQHWFPIWQFPFRIVPFTQECDSQKMFMHGMMYDYLALDCLWGIKLYHHLFCGIAVPNLVTPLWFPLVSLYGTQAGLFFILQLVGEWKGASSAHMKALAQRVSHFGVWDSHTREIHRSLSRQTLSWLLSRRLPAAVM